MPYRIEEAAHFTGVTAAAIRVIDRAGMRGLTWQAVAREAQMTIGAVRHRCDLDRQRLVMFVVTALCRAREERLRSVRWWFTPGADPLAHALALLPRTETERRQARVLALLEADPSLGPAADQLVRLRQEHWAWCRLVTRARPRPTPDGARPSVPDRDGGGHRGTAGFDDGYDDGYDDAAALVVCAVTTWLVGAVARRDRPVDLADAEELLRNLLAPYADPGSGQARHRARTIDVTAPESSRRAAASVVPEVGGGGSDHSGRLPPRAS